MSFSSNYISKKHNRNKKHKKNKAAHNNHKQQLISRNAILNNNRPQTVHLPKYNNTDEHFTNTVWNIWAHDKADTDFTNDSYKKCYTIRTFEDFWVFFNNVNDFSRHQFYIMRKNIAPIYEVKENINGGGLSFLIQNHHLVKQTLIETCIRVISENLVHPKYYAEITGIYLNPKKDGANLKIWFTNYEWLQANVNEIYIDDIKTLTSKRISQHNKQ